MLLRARVVLPLSQPPIKNGFVRVVKNRVTTVGVWADAPDEPVIDLGEVILLPGLVNAHCHLDYTDFVGAIPPPKSFTDWIDAIVDLKADVDDAAHADSWRHGADQCLRYGTTTLGNIESRPDQLPHLWLATPLRVVSFFELILFKPESNAAQAVEDVESWLTANLPPQGRAGLSPHAPYTTNADLLEACSRKARLLAIHLAESADEHEMFCHGRGRMFERLASAGRVNSDCGFNSPIAHAAAHGILRASTLAIHANYLSETDVKQLAKSRASVVHCPRSHEYFRHEPFNEAGLSKAGVNLCLGTDSLATTREREAELSLFDEMRLHAVSFPSLTAETILRRTTLNAAAALGMGGEVGEISEGAFADLITVPFAGNADGAVEAVVRHAGRVQAVMVDGQWEVPPPSLPARE